MRYILHCLLRGAVVPYQMDLIHAIAQRFDLQWTERQALAPHFTVKYWFESDDITGVESILEKFSKTHSAAPVLVGGAGSFPPDVVFLNVALSPEASAMFHALVEELRRLPWMQWHEHDGAGLHFHATVAERCGPQHDAVRALVKEDEQYFQCAFDNVTILQQTGTTDGIDRWSVHRVYRLGQ
jgi:2'-5' RNA ligase